VSGSAERVAGSRDRKARRSRRLPADLQGKVVLITGANSGIGYFTAKALATARCLVAGLDIAIENLQVLAQSMPERVLALRCDVTGEEQVTAACESVAARWGRIDVLVNNACVSLYQPFEQRTPQSFAHEIDVNYLGYVRMIQAVLPYMKRQGHGLIHNVSSGIGITGFGGASGYAATKGAIEGFTRSLALELEKYGIVCNLVHPPLVNTVSTKPLGLPQELMAKAEDVGWKIAKRMLCTRPVVTPDFRTAAFLIVARMFPAATGRLLSRMTAQARSRRESGPARAP